MNDKDKSALEKALLPLGNLIAEQMAEELEMKGGLLQPKQSYIQHHAEQLVQKVQSELEKREKNMQLATKLLQERLPILPEVERKQIETEMRLAGEKLQKGIESELKPEDTLQSILGISNPTMLWMYRAGRELFQEGKKEEAFAIYQMITTINPLVADYWVAQGLVLRSLQEETEALYAFSLASLLNPEQPVARYHSAELYLLQQQLADAEKELQALERIIDSHKRVDLQPATQALKTKIQLAKAS